MNLPIYGYGNQVLTKQAERVEKGFPDLDILIANMWRTMSYACGCGLAASQIGKPIQLFVVDSVVLYCSMSHNELDEFFETGDTGIHEVFINAEIISESIRRWEDIEGCLSVPYLSGKVIRPWSVRVRYENEHFELQEKDFSGMTARVILHEYDHTQGILYLNRLKPDFRMMIEDKLKLLLKGKWRAPYKMKF